MRKFFWEASTGFSQTERTRYCCLTPTRSSSIIYHPPHPLPYPTLQAASKEFYLKSWGSPGMKDFQRKRNDCLSSTRIWNTECEHRPVPLVESLVNPSLELRRSQRPRFKLLDCSLPKTANPQTSLALREITQHRHWGQISLFPFYTSSPLRSPLFDDWDFIKQQQMRGFMCYVIKGLHLFFGSFPAFHPYALIFQKTCIKASIT